MYTPLVRQFLRDDAIVLDAGAHHGEDTTRLAELWPEGRVLAFEASPVCHPILRAKLASYSNIDVYPTALGEKTGTIQLYLSRDDTSGADTILPPVPEDTFWDYMLPKDFSQTVEVPVWNLDEWAEKQKIEQIDFLHLDLEGAEGTMLQAAPRMLKRASFIQVEYRHTVPFKGMMNFPDMIQMLHRNGFNLLRAQEHKAAYFNVVGDALFIRSDI